VGALPEFNNNTVAFQKLFLVAFKLAFRLNSLLPFVHQLSRRCCSDYKFVWFTEMNYLTISSMTVFIAFTSTTSLRSSSI
jgi:hypothetical protein